MSQAYPQFTPVQILEAGQRAFAEGRTEYAAQFFKHLIDHYSDTPEAAVARDAMGQVSGAVAQPAAAPQYAQANGVHPTAATGAQPAPGYAPSTASNGSLQGVPLGANGAGAQTNGHGQAGYGANGHTLNGANGHANSLDTNGYAPAQRGGAQQPSSQAQRALHTRPSDGMQMPQQPQRQAPAHQHPHVASSAAPAESLHLPAPEKNYIIGRVIAGLLLLIGILGIFAGIVLVYAAISDPAIFARFGMTTQAAALIFSSSVFIGSIMALILAQVATAMFDGADAVADLSRLERFRIGDTDGYDE